MQPILIPGLVEFLRLCIQPDFYDRILQFSLVFGIAMMIFVTFKNIPYGKTYTSKKSILGVEIKDRTAVILINFPALFIFFYSQIFYPNGDLFSIPSIVYIAHYIHRGLIYPWFRKSYSKPWPLESVIYFLIVNFLTGLSISHTLIFSGKSINIVYQLAIAAVCVSAAIVAAVHDYKLCSLRSSGEQGYKIPQGLLFKWISGPNYLFEIIEWVAYLFYLPMGFALATIGIWFLVNLTGRAEANHAAYAPKGPNGEFRVSKIFPKGTKYPEDRTPYVPFIANSKYLF